METFEKHPALLLVLDYIERHNKQDKEPVVAEAARQLSNLVSN